MPETDVLIIGGGISGLSVAWGLAQRGVRAQLWESADAPGGKISSHAEAGYLTERSASLLMNFRPEVTRFLHDTGLESAKLRRDEARQGKRYLVQDAELREVPMQPGRLLMSPFMSRSGKLRMLLEGLVPAGDADGESVAQFIRRRFGSEMLERAIDPFVAGTLASDPERADAATTLPRLTALERRYGSITLGVLANRLLRRKTASVSETFSFAGGMSQLIQTLAQTPGLRLMAGHRAMAMSAWHDGWRVQGQGPHGDVELRARQLVLSTPADVAAGLLAPLDQELSRLLSAIDYAPLAVVHLGLPRSAVRHPLDGTGFLVPGGERLSFNGNLWLGSLFPGRAPPGHTLLTSYVGGARHPQRAQWSDERLASRVQQDLTTLLGLTGTADYLRVDRHPRALPLYHGNYSAHLRALQARLDHCSGLHLTANYRGGVSVRDRIVEGMKTAEKVAAGLHEGRCRSPLGPMIHLPEAGIS